MEMMERSGCDFTLEVCQLRFMICALLYCYCVIKLGLIFMSHYNNRADFCTKEI